MGGDVNDKQEKYLKIIQDTEPKINPKQFIQLNRKDYFKLPKKYEQQLDKDEFVKYFECTYDEAIELVEITE